MVAFHALAAMQAAAEKPTEIGSSLSGIFGCISLVAWICLLLPQLIANYKAQNADALSMGFLIIWLLGDLTNLAGALITNLAPSAIAIGCYFCVADIILISQVVYYKTRNAHRAKHRWSIDSAEESPLLGRDRSGSNAAVGGLPGSQRQHSMRRDSSGLDPLARMVTGEDETPQRSAWLTNSLSLLAVYALGIAAWFVSREVMGKTDTDEDTPVAGSDGQEPKTTLMALGIAFGYASAACYLTARIPQIIKNWREKSTEGLALLFFLLSLTGNLTYGASLVAFRQDSKYLLNALPWLLGSLGTIAEDCCIFVQFKLYSPKKEAKSAANDSGNDHFA